MSAMPRTLSGLVLLALAGSAAAQEPAEVSYAKGRKLCDLEDTAIAESSGLDRGLANDGIFWTHNDSGSGPQLYAFDDAGLRRATVNVAGAGSVDWEDMSSFGVGKKRFLLVADVGDNDKARRDYALYVVAEPSLGDRVHTEPLQLPPALTIRFCYPDGPENCEAVAVDPERKVILLATREEKANRSRVYSLPLPQRSPKKPLVAEPVAELPLRKVTAMDVSEDGLHAVVLTYGKAHTYRRAPEETWAQAFARDAQRVTIPRRRQGESVCYGADDRSLYLTSEKVPTPLFVVPAKPTEPAESD